MENNQAETKTEKTSTRLKSLAIICTILIACIAPYAILFGLRVPIYGWTQVFYYFVALAILPFLAVVGVACGFRFVERNIWRGFGMALGSVSIGLCAFVLLQWARLEPLILRRVGSPQLSKAFVGTAVPALIVWLIATYATGRFRRKPATHILLLFSSVCAGISAYQAVQYLPRFVERGYDLNALYRAPTEDLLNAVAPMFSLQTVQGETHSLESDRGKVVLIDFWATWCAPCIAEMPHLEKLYHELNGPRTTFLAVSLDQDSSKVKPFIDSLGYSFTTLYGNRKVGDAYRVTGIPATFVVDKKGIIREVMLGYNEDKSIERMRNSIRKLLNE